MLDKRQRGSILQREGIPAALESASLSPSVKGENISALRRRGESEAALDAGADEIIIKPVNPLELQTRVRSLLRLWRLKTELEQVLRAFGGEEK